jgi:hypothetical protein
LVDGGIYYFKGDADVNVSVVAQNFLMVKMAAEFWEEKNYGLTVTVSSKPWWRPGRREKIRADLKKAMNLGAYYQA